MSGAQARRQRGRPPLELCYVCPRPFKRPLVCHEGALKGGGGVCGHGGGLETHLPELTWVFVLFLSGQEADEGGC